MRLLLLFNVLLTVVVSHSAADTSSGDLPGSSSLDTLVEDSAFKTIGQHHPRTGALNQVLLPANLSGMKVSVVRLRSKTLWRRGTNLGGFSIPPRTITVPHVKRLLIVYHDLGNWSNWYYAHQLHGYSLATSVVGFTVYEASDVNSISTMPVNLDTRGRPISIHFRNVETSSIRSISSGKCALFHPNGMTSFSNIVRPNMCHSEEEGKFAIIVPAEKKDGQHRLWVVGLVVGSIGLLIISCFFGLLTRIRMRQKARVVTREVDEDEMFGSIRVADSRMPYAIVTRTQPVLEN